MRAPAISRCCDAQCVNCPSLLLSLFKGVFAYNTAEALERVVWSLEAQLQRSQRVENLTAARGICLGSQGAQLLEKSIHVVVLLGCR